MSTALGFIGGVAISAGLDMGWRGVLVAFGVAMIVQAYDLAKSER